MLKLPFFGNSSYIIMTLISKMPKDLIISMAQNYPFGAYEGCSKPENLVLVRRIYQGDTVFRKGMFQKLAIRRQLGHKHLIKVETVMDDEQSIHVMFEYVPIRVEKWMAHINDEFIGTFKDQLISLAAFLARNHINTSFHLGNVGMDHNYDAKYFLDLDYEFDPSLDVEELKTTYICQIMAIFDPQPVDLTTAALLDQTSRIQEKLFCDVQSTKKVGKLLLKEPEALKETLKIPNKVQEWKKVYEEANLSIDVDNIGYFHQFMGVLDNDNDVSQFDAVKKTTLAQIDRKYAQGKSLYCKQFSQRSFSLGYRESYDQDFDVRRLSSIGSFKKSKPAPFCQEQSPVKIQAHFDSEDYDRHTVISSEKSKCRPQDRMSMPHGCNIIKKRQTISRPQFRCSIAIRNQVQLLVIRSKNVIKKFKGKLQK